MFFPGMQSRALRIAALAWVGLWFGLLVPWHTRGAVQLPGKNASLPSFTTCCAPSKPADTASKDSPLDKGGPASNCAVCHFIATLDIPLPTVFYEPFLGTAAIAATVRPVAPYTPVLTRVPPERGPPAVSSNLS